MSLKLTQKMALLSLKKNQIFKFLWYFVPMKAIFKVKFAFKLFLQIYFMKNDKGLLSCAYNLVC